VTTILVLFSASALMLAGVGVFSVVSYSIGRRVRELAIRIAFGASKESIITEIRFALRHLARNPSFSVLVILTLALGIGACTAIFSVVNGVLLSDLPYADPDRLIRDPRPRAFCPHGARGIALALAVVGVYGVVAFAASRRTFEIGIRMALGAEASEVRRMVVRHGLAPVTIGIVIGVAGGAAAAQTLRGLLYNVQPLDPVTLIVVPRVIVAAALVASLIPAWRASRVEPSDVLRSE